MTLRMATLTGTASWTRLGADVFLHSYETEFVHPFTGDSVVLKAPIPPDMHAMILKLEALG